MLERRWREGQKDTGVGDQNRACLQASEHLPLTRVQRSSQKCRGLDLTAMGWGGSFKEKKTMTVSPLEEGQPEAQGIVEMSHIPLQPAQASGGPRRWLHVAPQVGGPCVPRTPYRNKASVGWGSQLPLSPWGQRASIPTPTLLL